MSRRRVATFLSVPPVVLLLLAISACAPPPPAAGWPRYRGPGGDGIAAEPSLSWPAAGPRVLWRVAAGPSFGQVSVRGDAAFAVGSDDESEYVLRLNAVSGAEEWRVPLGPTFTSEFGNGPRATPTLHGDRVFALGGTGTLVALDAGDGSVAWRVDLGERFGVEVPRFGFSGSPLVVDDVLVVGVGGKEGSSLAALDLATGEVRWTALDGPAGYSSPLLTTLAGERQIVFIRDRTVTGLDLAGAVRWTYDLDEGSVAMPVPVGGDRLFVSASGDSGCALLQIERDGDGLRAREVWRNRDMRNHFNSSVAHGGEIYGFDNATLKCLSVATGELLWAKRGFGKGSLAVAGDTLAVLTDKGDLILAEATPEEFRPLGEFQALEGKCWTAPSVADGRVFLRNLSEVTALDLRG